MAHISAPMRSMAAHVTRFLTGDTNYGPPCAVCCNKKYGLAASYC